MALLPGNRSDDPTFRAVRTGLTPELTAAGWQVVGAEAPRAEVVHVHVGGEYSVSTAAAVKRLVAGGARLILTLQDLDHPDIRPNVNALFRLRHAWRAATAVSALTVELARAGRRRLGARRVAVIGNGVGNEWTPRRSRRPAGELLVASGRLAPYKGIDILLWAFADLLRDFPDARLLIFGRDFESGRHQRLANALGLGARVRFTGDQAASRRRVALKRSRAFVFPSRRETWGMALIEAMACGIPCVVARTGVAASLRHGRDAWLVTPGDWKSLARGLSRVWRDDVLRRRLEKAGPLVAGRHSWRLRAADYLRLYDLRGGSPARERFSLRSGSAVFPSRRSREKTSR